MRENTQLKKLLWSGPRKAPNPCHYCGAPTPYARATVDHRIPRSKGGSHDTQNCVIACHGCNEDKGDLTEAQYRRALNLKRRRSTP